MCVSQLLCTLVRVLKTGSSWRVSYLFHVVPRLILDLSRSLQSFCNSILLIIRNSIPSQETISLWIYLERVLLWYNTRCIVGTSCSSFCKTIRGEKSTVLPGWTCARGIRANWEPLRCVCDPWPFAHTRTPCAATRCSTGQGPVGGRAGPFRSEGTRGESSVTEPERPGRSRTALRATCKLVPAAKMLPRARHSCVEIRRRPSFTLQAHLTRVHAFGRLRVRRCDARGEASKGERHVSLEMSSVSWSSNCIVIQRRSGFVLRMMILWRKARRESSF